ncbi:MAG: PKD domain-containing protein [Bacteroidia bacterium]|nr:PKD domain-containing protein [Bacteroidia bacterium]
MKSNYQLNAIRQGLIVLCLFLASSANAQLSGSFTINPTISASSSNYSNLSSAISDLLSGSRSDGGTAQGPGISANVTFTVYDTIYNTGPIEITSITGSNPFYRILFKSAGSNSQKCVFSNPSSSSSTNDFVLNLNGADYITFQNIGFVRTGTADYATVVQIGNDANNVIFDKCLLKGKKVPSNSTNGFNYTVGTCLYFYGNADSTIVKNSRLLYVYNGVYCVSAATDILFADNVIDSSGSSGIYMTTQTNLKITGNTFNMGDFGANLGHYTSYGMRIESSPAMQIFGNKIFMSAVNGQVVRGLIIASTTSTAAAPTMIYNNWIVNSGGSGDCTGFALYACNYLNFFYNNVLITSPLTNSSAYYHYPQYANTYIRLVNNNFINKGAGYSYNVSGTNTTDIDSLDYNNLFSSGTNLANWSGTNYTTLSGLQSASSKDVNSINVDPGFINSRDLHVSNIGLNGKAMKYPWISMDIDNEARDTSTPDIGADEFFPIANDAGINSVDSPMVFCAGTHNVRVKFQNFGYDTIHSVQIQWQINGTGQTAYNWTGNLAPGASSASILLGSYTFVANTAYNFKAWTVNPNNITDGKKNNDSLALTRYPGMTGSYKISDSLNADFKSFNSAIAAFTARGICGPIKFLVAPGIYNEQITLLELPGMGASNPITFEGMSKDSTDVLVTLPSTVATGNNNATIQLRGADYMRFKYITFERTGINTYANVIHILNGSDNNEFSHCRMLGVKLTSANANAQNIWSDLGVDNNNAFINNTVRFGYNNILYLGTSGVHESGTIIRGNQFDSAYNSSVQIAYNDGIDISGNIFKRVLVPAGGNFSLQLNDCDKAIKLIQNKFEDQGLENSIQLIACNASSNAPGIIANNMLSKGSGKSIVLDGVEYINIVFNSMYLNQAVSTNYGIYSTLTTSTDIVMKNNIIFMEGGEAFFIPTTSQVSASDYNNLVVKGGQFAFWGNSYTSLNDLKIASGKDVNSQSINPFFKSATDLHIFNPLLKGSGQAIAGITTDFDGELRNSTNPDIGADEFKLKEEDAGIVQMTSPNNNDCAGLQDIVVVIKNFGNDTLTSADVNWTVLGNVQTTYNWTGSLLTNEMDTIVIGSHNFIGNLNPKFAIWTSMPNGIVDPIPFNDSIVLNRSVRSLPVANAGLDASICSGDLAILGVNAVNGHTYEWTDLGSNILATTAQFNVSPKVQTTYILEVTNTTFGCKKRDTVVISINPVPVANAGTDKILCYGNSVQIGAASQAGFSYNWSSSVGNFSSSISNPVVAPLQSTNYILTKVINSTGCFDTDTVLVAIAFPPSASISGTGSSCQDEAFNYSAAAATGNTYSWDIVGGQIIGTQNANSVFVKWITPGNGKVTLIQSKSAACKDTVSYNVLVFKNPVAAFGFEEDCLGGTTMFSDSSKDANSYVWDFGNGKKSFSKNPFHTYESAKAYTVTLVAIGVGNCSDTTSKTIQVYPIPVADFDVIKTAGLTYSFTDMSTIVSGTITEWNWNFGDGNVSTDPNPTHVYDYNLLGQSFNVQLCVKSDFDCSSCFNKVNTVTSIADLYSSKGLKLYPNPSSGLVFLEALGTISSIEVVNALGQVVMKLNVENDKLELNLSDLANGVYTIKAFVDGQFEIVTIVIQR